MPNNHSTTLQQAIYGRRSVRSYESTKLDRATVQQLLDAAVHAPTAVHEEPWQFIVIQDKQILRQLSERAKELAAAHYGREQHANSKHLLQIVSDPDFNVFYDAGTLIAIAVKPMSEFVVADAWLAAENMLLTAYSLGVGSCVIGFAVAALNDEHMKREIGIPVEMKVIAPLIVGKPRGEVAVSPRKPAEILVWK